MLDPVGRWARRATEPQARADLRAYLHPLS
jgi:hypothetical protein